MRLRRKFILYLVLMHLPFAVLAAILIRRDALWLFVVEAIFVVSLVWGARLVSAFFGSLDLIRSAVQTISDQDFTSRFREVGQPEMDELIHVYNRMIDHLREERTRLQEQHFFLDRVLTASPSGIITLDLDGHVAMVNPSAARMLGEPAQELIGRKLAETGGAIAGALLDLRTGESRVVPFGGRRRLKCTRSEFADRGFPRAFFLMEELTEELRQSEKSAYEKLIRMMSHEVNNSVGSVNSLLHSCMTYAAQLSGEDRADFETAIAVAISRTDQLGIFMRGFADVVRLPPPRPQPAELRRLLEGVEVLTRADRERRRIAWAWDVERALPPVRLDVAQMEQVFLNVVKNAVEAIGEAGTITIRMGVWQHRPFVTVEDTGCGIAPEVRANLFAPFFTTKENGQGVGLTLVQEILAAHHFEFTLDGPPGGPTRFTILF
ncbi:MAG TPA: ATP-binding protein [Blastocatellia bacterium]|nr:ATP-binding protein [Blastocatellia bacterium]